VCVCVCVCVLCVQGRRERALLPGAGVPGPGGAGGPRGREGLPLHGLADGRLLPAAHRPGGLRRQPNPRHRPQGGAPRCATC